MLPALCLRFLGNGKGCPRRIQYSGMDAGPISTSTDELSLVLLHLDEPGDSRCKSSPMRLAGDGLFALGRVFRRQSFNQVQRLLGRRAQAEDR